MAGGFVVASGNKIKGGRWTVFRFFLVSVAFTSAWVAVSSQLGYYRQIHGPAVLLQLNIAYFMPSIPLLIFSAFLDKPLEERLGAADAGAVAASQTDRRRANPVKKLT